MKTATLIDPQQSMAVLQAWFRDDIKPGTMAGQKYELSLKARKDTKSRLQEEKYHAMIGDIAEQTTLYGKKLPESSWKRVLVDAFKHETKDDPEFRDEWAKFGEIELVPALNHAGFVMVGEQTRRFSVKLAAGFIEFLLAHGADQGVKWSTPKSWGHAPS